MSIRFGLRGFHRNGECRRSVSTIHHNVQMPPERTPMDLLVRIRCRAKSVYTHAIAGCWVILEPRRRRRHGCRGASGADTRGPEADAAGSRAHRRTALGDERRCQRRQVRRNDGTITQEHDRGRCLQRQLPTKHHGSVGPARSTSTTSAARSGPISEGVTHPGYGWSSARTTRSSRPFRSCHDERRVGGAPGSGLESCRGRPRERDGNGPALPLAARPEFRIGDADFSTQWGWIPLLDFALGLTGLLARLPRSQHESFEFTESGAELRFELIDGDVEVRSNFVAAIGRAPLDALRGAVRRLAEEILHTARQEAPGIDANSNFRRLANDLSASA